MAAYRVPEFTLEQRAEAALQMLVPRPERRWGLMSKLARLYGVLRTRLYELCVGVGGPDRSLAAWRDRSAHALALNLGPNFSQALRSVVPIVWETLGLFHRSSSSLSEKRIW